MKKNIIKNIFIKFLRKMGYEIIDQNNFFSPTLNKELNKNLTNNEKSIILPLGEVRLTKKISDLLIIFRTNTNIDIWDQNKKRIFEKPKVEYAKRSLFSIIKAIENLNKKYPLINVIINVKNVVYVYQKYPRIILECLNAIIIFVIVVYINTLVIV